MGIACPSYSTVEMTFGKCPDRPYFLRYLIMHDRFCSVVPLGTFLSSSKRIDFPLRGLCLFGLLMIVLYGSGEMDDSRGRNDSD
jgi:hypothetical protein